ncbi:DUF6069 family protein [Streptomyces sp. ACA25]|uniref:DUF6069 family protein n=1 Tax=Streptomyces sp. ACA25 TaxID=3022596 RepID=UPI0023079403|nr:DUF6069 family protein [Streptomyces sp. ACA25]MDB1087563.1 DUF6069 family protein [Streptomyces sp. ACA25]
MSSPGPYEPSDPRAAQTGPDPYAERRGAEPGADPHTAPPPPDRPRLNAGRLWGGGVMTALVAALAAAVAMMLVHGVLGIEVFAPEEDGSLVLTDTLPLALGAAAAALVATALLHVLMLITPAPDRFFAWIVALATAAMVLLPFTRDTDWESRFATGGVYLVIGLVIGSLLSSVGRRAVR